MCQHPDFVRVWIDSEKGAHLPLGAAEVGVTGEGRGLFQCVLARASASHLRVHLPPCPGGSGILRQSLILLCLEKA